METIAEGACYHAGGARQRAAAARNPGRMRLFPAAAAVIELSQDSYLALRAGAQVLEADRHGDKVLRLADGTYLKLFRRKRLFSSAAWYPYARRFADNAVALAQRGIPCPEVLAVYRVRAIRRHAVHYRPLAGRTLREVIASGEAEPGLRERFGAFVARLHGFGVYFRSLHLGNVVLTPHDQLGLIDIADLVIVRSGVGPRLLARNVRHLCRYAADHAWLAVDGGRAFVSGYTSLSRFVPVVPTLSDAPR